MTLPTPSSLTPKPFPGKPSHLRSWNTFWDQTVLPGWVPLLAGLGLSVVIAYLIAKGLWLWLIPVALIVPLATIFIKYPSAAVFLWLLFFPFILQEPFAGARQIYWVLHRALIPGTLFLVIVIELVGVRKRPPIRLGLAEFAVAGFLIYSVINILLFTQKPNTPVDMLIRFYDRLFVPLCMYGLVRLAAPSEAELRWLIPISIIGIFAQSFTGVSSWFFPGLLPNNWLNRFGERTVGTFGNPAVLSTTLLFFALILLQASLKKTSTLNRWLYLGAFGLAFFMIFFTFSRGSWLAGFVVWAGLFFLVPKPMTRITAIGAVVAVILGASVLVGFTGFARDRLVNQDTAAGRIIEGAASLRMITTRPIFGWGYANHEFFDEQFRTRIIAASLDRQQSSHNTFLLLTAEMGLLGLFLYMFPAGYWLFRTVKYHRALPRFGFISWSMLWMLWLLLAAHFIAMNFTDLIQSNFFSTSMWWMSLGLIAVMIDHACCPPQYLTGHAPPGPSFIEKLRQLILYENRR